jgi:hypothetical protein
MWISKHQITHRQEDFPGLHKLKNGKAKFGLLNKENFTKNVLLSVTGRRFKIGPHILIPKTVMFTCMYVLTEDSPFESKHAVVLQMKFPMYTIYNKHPSCDSRHHSFKLE